MTWKDLFPKDHRYFETENGILYHADNMEVLRQIADNVIDTVITDPPYGLRFMQKKWDYDVPSVETWQEILRVMKPGATLLSFAGSRTQHRMAVNIEDAGFILKDTLMWVYSTGFPKATDISKMIDKKLGAERDVLLTKVRSSHENGSTYKWSECNDTGICYITAPATPEAKLWDGYKSHGLKPAYEPIIMAIKQNDGSYADNALKWGVAGLNIDAGRVPLKGEWDIKNGWSGSKKVPPKSEATNSFGVYNFKEVNRTPPRGRFPANILLDEEVARLLDEQSGVSRSRAGIRRNHNKGHEGWSGSFRTGDLYSGYNDKGGASRFFYVAKASKRERNVGLESLEKKLVKNALTTHNGTGEFRGVDKKPLSKQQNFHPTVKPLKLIEYLVKLTLMPNPDQIYLDPFLGSGTTAMACELLGRKWIGIELDEEYCEIAKRRITAVVRGDLELKEKRKKGAEKKRVKQRKERLLRLI